MSEEKEVAHSCNVQLPDTLIVQLQDIHRYLLSNNFHEQRFYDTTLHLNFLTKFMNHTQTPEFIQCLTEEFCNDTIWEVGFSQFSVQGKYIFLEVDDASKEVLHEVHTRAQLATQHIGSEGQASSTSIHPFHPHISMIKLEPVEAPAALKVLQQDFSNVHISVQAYEMTVQKDDESGFSTFPVASKIALRTSSHSM